VLELSIQDKGGRRNWNDHVPASSSSAGGSVSQANTNRQPTVSSATAASHQQAHSTDYIPATETQHQTHTQMQSTAPTVVESSRPTAVVPCSSTTSEVYAMTRAGALYTFEPTGPGGLAFERRGIISYRSWTGNIRMGGEGSSGSSYRLKVGHKRMTIMR